MSNWIVIVCDMLWCCWSVWFLEDIVELCMFTHTQIFSSNYSSKHYSSQVVSICIRWGNVLWCFCWMVVQDSVIVLGVFNNEFARKKKCEKEGNLFQLFLNCFRFHTLHVQQNRKLAKPKYSTITYLYGSFNTRFTL